VPEVVVPRDVRGAVNVVLVAAAMLLALPSVAGAWTATLADGRLTIADGAGRADAIALVDDGGGLRVVNEGALGLEGAAPAGCLAASGDLLCAAGIVTAVSVDAGGGDDRVEDDSSLALVAGGGAGDDQLLGGAADDVLDGGDGADRLTGGAGEDRLAGVAGDDELSGGAGIDRLDGGDGRDRLDGGDAGDALIGGADADTLYGGAANDALDGGDGDDVLDGGAGDDVLDGAGGDDVLQAAQGADVLHGGAGADRLVASGVEATELDGDDGDDTLQGGPARDLLDGGGGDDALDGGDGPDVLAGGLGHDTADYGQRVAPVAVTIGAGADDGARGEQDDVRGDVEQVRGGAGDDLLTAGADAAQLRGGLGNDTLRGGAGADLLDGGEGDDRLLARSSTADKDVVRCGAGVDGFDADRSDAVAADCESGRVDGVAVDSVAQLRGGPSLALLAPSVRVVRVDRRNRFALNVACGARTVGRCAVKLVVRAKFGRRTLRIGRARFRLAAGKARLVRLRVPRPAARALRRADRGGFAARMDMSVVDALGRAARQRVALRAEFARSRR
jgi:Ca2+-binding RTX toxin-like protein